MPDQTKQRHRGQRHLPMLAIAAGAIAGLTPDGWTAWILVGPLLLGLSVLGVMAAVLFVPKDYPYARLIALARTIRSTSTARPQLGPTSPHVTAASPPDSTA